MYFANGLLDVEYDDLFEEAFDFSYFFGMGIFIFFAVVIIVSIVRALISKKRHLDAYRTSRNTFEEDLHDEKSISEVFVHTEDMKNDNSPQDSNDGAGFYCEYCGSYIPKGKSECESCGAKKRKD